MVSKAKKLAKYEIGWWQAHHRKDHLMLVENMSKLYSEQFNLSENASKLSVIKRVEAAKEHDLAEELEDKGEQLESNKHWRIAENLLEKHFEILLQSLKNKNG